MRAFFFSLVGCQLFSLLIVHLEYNFHRHFATLNECCEKVLCILAATENARPQDLLTPDCGFSHLPYLMHKGWIRSRSPIARVLGSKNNNAPDFHPSSFDRFPLLQPSTAHSGGPLTRTCQSYASRFAKWSFGSFDS